MRRSVVFVLKMSWHDLGLKTGVMSPRNFSGFDCKNPGWNCSIPCHRASSNLTTTCSPSMTAIKTGRASVYCSFSLKPTTATASRFSEGLRLRRGGKLKLHSPKLKLHSGRASSMFMSNMLSDCMSARNTGGQTTSISSKIAICRKRGILIVRRRQTTPTSLGARHSLKSTHLYRLRERDHDHLRHSGSVNTAEGKHKEPLMQTHHRGHHG